LRKPLHDEWHCAAPPPACQLIPPAAHDRHRRDASDGLGGCRVGRRHPLVAWRFARRAGQDMRTRSHEIAAAGSHRGVMARVVRAPLLIRQAPSLRVSAREQMRRGQAGRCPLFRNNSGRQRAFQSPGAALVRRPGASPGRSLFLNIRAGSWRWVGAAGSWSASRPGWKRTPTARRPRPLSFGGRGAQRAALAMEHSPGRVPLSAPPVLNSVMSGGQPHRVRTGAMPRQACERESAHFRPRFRRPRRPESPAHRANVRCSRA